METGIYIYVVAFVFFWIGFLMSSAIWVGKEKNAETLRDVERAAKREHGKDSVLNPNTKTETVVVGELLERKRAPSRRTTKVKGEIKKKFLDERGES